MLACTGCQAPLGRHMMNTYELVTCPACKGKLRLDVFPALFRKQPATQNGELLQQAKEAGCYYHPRKKAAVTCSACGRFLCALCDIEFNARHLCSQCLEKGKTKRKIRNLENHRICYDTVALVIALVPMLLYWFTIVTAPIVLFITVRYWRAPSSIVPRTKLRFILAAVIALLQIIGWLSIFTNLIPYV